MRCSVWNKTSLIDLSPLIHLSGYYTATDEDAGENANKDENKDTSRVFYINICQPLNPIPGVKCPPGAAVCMDPPEGDPIVSLFPDIFIWLHHSVYEDLGLKKKKTCRFEVSDSALGCYEQLVLE